MSETKFNYNHGVTVVTYDSYSSVVVDGVARKHFRKETHEADAHRYAIDIVLERTYK